MSKFGKIVLLTVSIFIFYSGFVHFAPAVAEFAGYSWDQPDFLSNYWEYVRIHVYMFHWDESKFQIFVDATKNVNREDYFLLPTFNVMVLSWFYYFALPLGVIGGIVEWIRDVWKKDS